MTKVSRTAAVITDAAPTNPTSEIRLLCKAEVLELTGLSFPTVWGMIRRGEFPAARTVGVGGGRPYWLAQEISDWVSNLPIRAYKKLGD
jgi:prophage regulatory protein